MLPQQHHHTSILSSYVDCKADIEVKKNGTHQPKTKVTTTTIPTKELEKRIIDKVMKIKKDLSRGKRLSHVYIVCI